MSLFPYPRYHLSTRSPSTIRRQQSSSDLCSDYTRGRQTSSTSSTLIGSITMPHTNIPSSTGATARKSGADTTTNSPRPRTHLFRLTSIRPIAPTRPNVFKRIYQSLQCLIYREPRPSPGPSTRESGTTYVAQYHCNHAGSTPQP